MNIFVLSEDPQQAARDQCDKHVVKMPLETAQMLCTALRQHGCDDVPYKSAHAKHPCTLWTAACRDNFLWLVEHGLELCAEYTRRYGKVHASQAVIVVASDLSKTIPTGALTSFAQAMPDQYKHESAVEAYRSYYKNEKAAIATWRYSTTPPWWQTDSHSQGGRGVVPPRLSLNIIGTGVAP
jgi:hypothetical protein